MRGVFCILVVLAIGGGGDAVDVQEGTQVRIGMTGTIGSQYWRVRSITNAVGEYWQIKEMQFFETSDGSGDPVSTDNIEKAQCSTYKDAPKPGQEDTSEHHAIKAVDGDADTYWSSSSDIKFEFVSVEFNAPKDIRSIKIQLTEPVMGPSMVIVEKSFDGIEWGRSTEISDMLDWGNSMQLYKLIDMDVIPPSTYALRSQVNPRFCVGVKPTPAENPEDPDLPLEEGAAIEMQPCSDARTTQYWQIRKDGLLGSAKDVDMVMYRDDLADGAVLTAKRYACDEDDNGEPLCPSWGATNKYNFGEAPKGGLMYSQSDNNMNLVLAPAAIEDAAAVKLGTCGAEGTSPPDIANCNDLMNNQFELKPMFLIEPNKMAIGCAPYTHMNIVPDEAKEENDAMTICAKNPDCLAYNWASADATCPTSPPCEGKYLLHSWSCTALHEVHSGQGGWSLGVRAGKLEPFVEEKEKY